jgi:hypothetical protein
MGRKSKLVAELINIYNIFTADWGESSAFLHLEA